MTKMMSLRLEDEQAAMLEMVARADDQSLTEAVRTAIDVHIEARRADDQFIKRLKQRHAREQALYERLAVIKSAHSIDEEETV